MVAVVLQTKTCETVRIPDPGSNVAHTDILFQVVKTATAVLGALSTFTASTQPVPHAETPDNSPSSPNDSPALNHGPAANMNSDSNTNLPPSSSFPNVPPAGILRINQCNYSAWFTSIAGSQATPLDPVQELHAGSSIYTPYAAIDIGVSEKYATQQFEHLSSSIPVLQLEYSLSRSEPSTIYYDISLIDCGDLSATNTGPCAFHDGGYLVEFTQDDAGAAQGADGGHRDTTSCPHVYCPHLDDPEQHCRSVYYFYDDIETFVCVKNGGDFWLRYNMTVTFCPSDAQLEPWGVESDSDDEDDRGGDGKQQQQQGNGVHGNRVYPS